MKKMNFDYFYGREAEYFNYFATHWDLIRGEEFISLSLGSKILYCAMLDRIKLSIKNNWQDEEGKTYIIYTIDNIMSDFNISRPTVVKYLKELDVENGIGLIERTRRGLGKPDIIYVRNYVAIIKENDEKSAENTDESTEVKKLYFRKLKNFTSESKETLLQEVKKFNPNQINNNQTNINQVNINQSINHDSMAAPLSPEEQMGRLMDGLMEEKNAVDYIKSKIEYGILVHDEPAQVDIINEIVSLMAEVVTSTSTTLRVCGENKPAEVVKSQILKNNNSTIRYVLSSLNNNTSEVKNIKLYIITALYNAPSTINNYFKSMVQHDLFSGDS